MTEYRHFKMTELRSENEKSFKVQGYAAKFDDETVLYEIDGVKYKEVIDRKAFDKADMSDVVMNFNHCGKPVARTRNGTLMLEIDNVGLKVHADLGGTEEGRKLFEEIKGGYIDKMSFAFTVRAAEYDGKKRLRRITAFDHIYDVSAVDFPAYESTEIYARSHLNAELKQKLKLKLLLR